MKYKEFLLHKHVLPDCYQRTIFFTLKQISVRFMHGVRHLFLAHRFPLTPKINVFRNICERNFDLRFRVEATQDDTLDNVSNI